LSAIYGELTIGGSIALYEEMRPCGQTQVLGLETGTNKDWHQQGPAPTRTGTNKDQHQQGKAEEWYKLSHPKLSHEVICGEYTKARSIVPYEEKNQ